MPIYNYRCSDCGKIPQIIHKMSAPTPASCPKCGAVDSLTKQVSKAGFALKGGGWYADGYSETSSATSESASSGSDSSSSTSSSGSDSSD